MDKNENYDNRWKVQHIYHENMYTKHNYVFAFVFKKMAARFPEISVEEIQKLVVNKKQSKLLRGE